MYNNFNNEMYILKNQYDFLSEQLIYLGFLPL